MYSRSRLPWQAYVLDIWDNWLAKLPQEGHNQSEEGVDCKWNKRLWLPVSKRQSNKTSLCWRRLCHASPHILSNQRWALCLNRVVKWQCVWLGSDQALLWWTHLQHCRVGSFTLELNQIREHAEANIGTDKTWQRADLPLWRYAHSRCLQ